MKINREKWQPCVFCDGGFFTQSDEYASTTLYMTVDPPRIGASGDEDVGETIAYCPMCGRPLTEEAWSELERRLFAQP